MLPRKSRAGLSQVWRRDYSCIAPLLVNDWLYHNEFGSGTRYDMIGQLEVKEVGRSLRENINMNYFYFCTAFATAGEHKYGAILE